MSYDFDIFNHLFTLRFVTVCLLNILYQVVDGLEMGCSALQYLIAQYATSLSRGRGSGGKAFLISLCTSTPAECHRGSFLSTLIATNR